MEQIDVVTKFVGFKLVDAERIAEQHGWLIRVIDKDGRVTAEYVSRRINVVVEDGLIVEVVNLG